VIAVDGVEKTDDNKTDDATSFNLIVNAPTNKTLTIRKLGTGTGSVSGGAGRINCAAGCTTPSVITSFSLNESVTLTITPAADSVLGSISGACTGSPCVIAMDDNKTVDITFTRNVPAVSCYASASGYTDPNSPVMATTATDIVWTANASGGVPPYTYSWSGDSPLAGKTGKTVSFKYSTLSTKYGKVTITDSVGSVQAFSPTDCSNVVVVGPTMPPPGTCNFALNPNPATLGMVFINPSTASNKTNISVNFPDTCVDDITLSVSPSELPSAVEGNPNVPLNYKFYNTGTTVENVAKKIIHGAGGNGYVVGLDMRVSADKMIRPGSYTITLTGTSNTAPTPVVRTQTIQLNVTNVNPTFENF
jgi:hypothetical protein